MAGDYSRIILFFNVIIMFFILVATVACFIAPSYLIAPANTSTSITSNLNTARSLLYGAGAIGAIITFLFLFSFIISWWTTPVLVITDPVSIAANQFGMGTILFIILMIAMFVFMMFLIIYAIMLIDTSVSGVSNGHWWAIVAIILVGLAFIFEFINLFFYYQQYSYLNSLTITEEVTKLQPISKPSSLADVFYFSRNPNTKGKFNGTISLEGELKEANEFIEYNGQIIENMEKAQTVPIKVRYPINELPENIRPKTNVVVQKEIIREERKPVRNMQLYG